MTSWQAARQAARDAAKPLEAVEVPLADALGATLAEPLTARTPMPAFDTSAMDGYAVAGHGPWILVGHVRAGGRTLPASANHHRTADGLARGQAVGSATGAPVPPSADAVLPIEQATRSGLAQGQAVGIATGAPVPPGTDAVLPVERATQIGLTVVGEVRVGQHVRRAGEDCAYGQELLPAGTVVSPAALGLAAAVGHDVLLVHRRPRVAVVLTGDEVVRAGTPGMGQVRDAIGPVLPGVLAAEGADLVDVGHVPDQVLPLAEALRRDDVDVLVVGGATSRGPADHLRTVLAELGADVRVAGVEVRPGHPQLLAVLPDGRCVVGLPGNPFAALAACATLLVPLLGALAGRTVRPVVTAELRADVVAHPRDTRLVPVAVTGSAAIPVGHDRPGTLWGAALADALAVVPPGWAGGPVELLRLAR